MNRSMLICQVLKEQIVPKDALIRLPLVTVLQIPWRRSDNVHIILVFQDMLGDR